MKIIFSKHSEEQNLKRKISKEFVKTCLKNPDRVERDKCDRELLHYIKFIEGKFLRVIIKKQEKSLFVITYFFDRRLKKGGGK